MVQQSKFSGALAQLREKAIPEEQAAELPAAQAQVAVPTPAVPLSPKGRGRPPGKRSDPNFNPTTVLLRKTTQRTAVRLLEDSQTKQDLSDLIEQLLTQWIKRKS